MSEHVPAELGPEDEVTLIMTVEVRYPATRRFYADDPEHPVVLPTDSMMAEIDQDALLGGEMSVTEILEGAERQNVTITVRAE